MSQSLIRQKLPVNSILMMTLTTWAIWDIGSHYFNKISKRIAICCAVLTPPALDTACTLSGTHINNGEPCTLWAMMHQARSGSGC